MIIYLAYKTEFLHKVQQHSQHHNFVNKLNLFNQLMFNIIC